MEERGYVVRLTPYTNDGGVDIIAERAGETVAVQVKMYGSSRKVNRQMIMELQGVKDLLKCSRAAIATDGCLLPDAAAAAEALGIEVLSIPSDNSIPVPSAQVEETVPPPLTESVDAGTSFEEIWSEYVMPLQGKTLYLSGDRPNTLLRVDWTGVQRVTSNGKPQFIGIEIFRKAVDRILTYGRVERQWINQHYPKRASSGITLILAQVPLFEHEERPSALKLRQITR